MDGHESIADKQFVEYPTSKTIKGIRFSGRIGAELELARQMPSRQALPNDPATSIRRRSGLAASRIGHQGLVVRGGTASGDTSPIFGRAGFQGVRGSGGPWH